MKQLKDLTLLDKFLFDETMDIPEAHEALLRSIRVDVYALDQNGTVYDTEMQAEHRTDLAKRSRYYQSLIDSSLLEPGSISFNKLNNTYIIMITPYDLFGEGKYRYTFVPCCKENKDIELKDGAIRIFLNTKGKNNDEVSRELIDFLHYVESTDEAIVKNSESERLKKIHACVSRIKSSEEVGVKYMQNWEEKIIEQEKVRQTTLLDSIKHLMQNLGLTVEQAMTALNIPAEEQNYYLNLINDQTP